MSSADVPGWVGQTDAERRTTLASQFTLTMNYTRCVPTAGGFKIHLTEAAAREAGVSTLEVNPNVQGTFEAAMRRLQVAARTELWRRKKVAEQPVKLTSAELVLATAEQVAERATSIKENVLVLPAAQHVSRGQSVLPHITEGTAKVEATSSKSMETPSQIAEQVVDVELASSAPMKMHSKAPQVAQVTIDAAHLDAERGFRLWAEELARREAAVAARGQGTAPQFLCGPACSRARKCLRAFCHGPCSSCGCHGPCPSCEHQ